VRAELKAVAVISERGLQRLADGKTHCVHAYAKVVDEDDSALVRLSDAQSALQAKEAEIAALKEVLIETRRVLEEENSKGVHSAIKDTIWRGPAETLFDYLDATIDSARAAGDGEGKS